MKNILLSIKPCHAHAILSGTKTVEYRKVVPKEIQNGIAYIYSSSPEKKIIGEFKFNGIIAMRPNKLWEETKERGGVDKDFFISYFADKRIAYAFNIESIKKYDNPVTLEYFGIKRAPQSWMYIENNIL